MSNAMIVLRDVLSGHGLTTPDGRPLYAYRCDDGTLERLTIALRAPGRERVGMSQADRAAFCLYASYYFARSHSEGVWSWEAVKSPIDLDVPYTQLIAFVESGLRWWGRRLDVVNDRTHYMMTLACEGGLPQLLLCREGAHVHEFFAAVLRERERFTATPSETLVQQQEHRLPQSWRNETIRSVSAAFIDAIADFRRAVGNSASSLDRLDRVRPGWRGELPMRVSDDVALTLIRGLMRQPTADAASTSGIGVSSYLRPIGDRWILEREVDLAPVISRDHLATEFEISADALPASFALHVVTSDSTPRRVATALTVSGDPPRFRIESDRVRFVDDDARTLGELTLAIVAGGRQLARTVPRGAEAIDDLPWSFDATRDGSGRHRALATGPFRTRRERVLVAIPEGATLDVTGEQTLRGRIGKPRHGSIPPSQATPLRLGARSVFEIAGKASVTIPDGEATVIETSSGEEVTREYRLVGGRVSLGIGGSEVWAGPPSLEERTASTTRRIAAGALEWRPERGTAPFRAVDSACVGDVQLRYRAGDEVRFRSRVTVLPMNTSIHLKATQARKGEVQLGGVRVERVEAGLAAGTTMSVLACGHDGVRLELACDTPPLATVPLWLTLPGDRRASIEVPFPSTEIQFVDPAGRILSDNAVISFESLLGSRVQVGTAGQHTTYMLTARLHGDRRTGSDDAEELQRLHAAPRMLGELVQDNVGRHILPLDQIYNAVRQLLSMSTDLDAFVALCVETLGDHVIPSRGRRGEIRVKRYDAWFDRAIEHREDRIRIRPRADVIERLGTAFIDTIRVDATPIGDPKGAAIAFERGNDEQGPFFEVARSGCTPGPWLAVGWEGDIARFRPLQVTVPGPAPDAPPGSFRAVAAIAEKTTRRTAFDELLRGLVRDVDDENWKPVDWVLGQLGRVPTTTYDVVDRLVRNHDAVALSILRVSGSGLVATMWSRLEELPFLWPLVPLRCWLAAARALWARYERAFPDDAAMARQAYGDAIARRFGLLSEHAPWMSVVWEVASDVVDHVPPPSDLVVHRIRHGQSPMPLLTFYREDLRRVHASDRYPEWVGDNALRRPEFASKTVQALEYTQPPRHQYDMQNAPLLAAAASVYAVGLSRVEIFELAKLRAFDVATFDQMYALLLARLAADEIRNHGGFDVGAAR